MEIGNVLFIDICMRKQKEINQDYKHGTWLREKKLLEDEIESWICL